jgi:hypothetical protein
MRITGVYCKQQHQFDLAAAASINDLKVLVCKHYKINPDSANMFQYNKETKTHKRDPFPDDEAKLHDALGRNRWIQVTNLSKGKSDASSSPTKGASSSKGGGKSENVTYEGREEQLADDIENDVPLKAYHEGFKGWYAISGIQETDTEGEWEVEWADGDTTDTLKLLGQLARDDSAG